MRALAHNTYPPQDLPSSQVLESVVTLVMAIVSLLAS